MDYVLPPQPLTAVPVAGSAALFPVRRVYCVGRNYAEHAKEMGFTGREDPFFFCKPADAVLSVADGETGKMPYPPKTSNLHYEMELVVVLGKGGRDIPVEEANDCVWGYALGLDMTRRDLQGEMKKQGRPWEVGKAFDLSAPLGPIHPRSVVGTLDKGAIWLDVNGQRKQASAPGDVSTTMPGNVVDVLVAVGDVVKAGQTVLVSEAMKMETPVVAPISGRLRRIAEAGSIQPLGAIVARIET